VRYLRERKYETDFGVRGKKPENGQKKGKQRKRRGR